MKPLILFLFTFISVNTLFSQAVQPFKLRYQSDVRGQMFLISNNIVNRQNASKLYNDTDSKAKHNDEFFMEYIDIDSDETTFYSSSADLLLDRPEDYTLVFAGLYWAGIYKYEEGKLKNKKFVVENPERYPVNQVKIKLLGSEIFVDVEGELIYDSFERKQFTSNMPYAVFADITEKVKALSNASGTYTVANVRATRGMLSGGVAAGWSLIFVFENKNLPYRYFNLFDGFTEAERQPEDIVFSGFQTLPEGEVSATIFGAAIEGDLNMKGDRLLFKTNATNDFVELENRIREKNNFFKSAITADDSYFNQRNPNNINTLGYDAFSLKINNPDNSVMDDKTNQATLRIQSYTDRFYFFMCGFSIDIQSVDKPTLQVEEKVNQVTEKIVIVEEKSVIEDKVTTVVTTEVIKEEIKTVKTEIDDESGAPVVRNAEMVGITPGFYLIANVFGNPNNADAFLAKLKSLGLDADYFINPQNNYRYVYVAHLSTYQEAKDLFQNKLGGKYPDEMWILKMNMN